MFSGWARERSLVWNRLLLTSWLAFQQIPFAMFSSCSFEKTSANMEPGNDNKIMCWHSNSSSERVTMNFYFVYRHARYCEGGSNQLLKDFQFLCFKIYLLKQEKTFVMDQSRSVLYLSDFHNCQNCPKADIEIFWCCPISLHVFTFFPNVLSGIVPVNITKRIKFSENWRREIMAKFLFQVN